MRMFQTVHLIVPTGLFVADSVLFISTSAVRSVPPPFGRSLRLVPERRSVHDHAARRQMRQISNLDLVAGRPAEAGGAAEPGRLHDPAAVTRAGPQPGVTRSAPIVVSSHAPKVRTRPRSVEPAGRRPDRLKLRISPLVMATAEIGSARCCLRCCTAPVRFAIPAAGVRLALLAIGQAAEQTRYRCSRRTPDADVRQASCGPRIEWSAVKTTRPSARRHQARSWTGSGTGAAEPPYCAPITTDGSRRDCCRRAVRGRRSETTYRSGRRSVL